MKLQVLKLFVINGVLYTMFTYDNPENENSCPTTHI